MRPCPDCGSRDRDCICRLERRLGTLENSPLLEDVDDRDDRDDDDQEGSA